MRDGEKKRRKKRRKEEEEKKVVHDKRMITRPWLLTQIQTNAIGNIYQL